MVFGEKSYVGAGYWRHINLESALVLNQAGCIAGLWRIQVSCAFHNKLDWVCTWTQPLAFFLSWRKDSSQAQGLQNQPVPLYMSVVGNLNCWDDRGKNDFLGTAYIAVGAICIALALVRPNVGYARQHV